MRRTLPIGAVMLLLVLVLVGAIAFAGLRVVSFPPANGQSGRTVVATGLRELRIIDSPQAYCAREEDLDPTCPMSFSIAIAHEGYVLVEIPYFAAIHNLAGAL